MKAGLANLAYLFRQFFDDFSYWDMDQWDLATVPVGLN